MSPALRMTSPRTVASSSWSPEGNADWADDCPPASAASRPRSTRCAGCVGDGWGQETHWPSTRSTRRALCLKRTRPLRHPYDCWDRSKASSSAGLADRCARPHRRARDQSPRRTSTQELRSTPLRVPVTVRSSQMGLAGRSPELPSWFGKAGIGPSQPSSPNPSRHLERTPIRRAHCCSNWTIQPRSSRRCRRSVRQGGSHTLRYGICSREACQDHASDYRTDAGSGARLSGCRRA